MKFTLNWLKDYLETDATLEEIADTLTAIGLEVENIHNPSDIYNSFVIAKVEKTEKHPDADRLKICHVNTGKTNVQVVCGAPNAREGMIGVFAPAGTYIPGIDLHLKKGNIRGVDSEGMLLSERELGLSDEHEGIVDLPDNPDIGQTYADFAHLNDPVIEIGLTPNRADCASIFGIARDLAAAGIGELKPPTIPAIDDTIDSPVNVSLAFENQDDVNACPIFIGRTIKGVKNGPSPDWLQQRLKAIGLRPISILVDITNYMTIAFNRPLHVFDLKKLNGDISVRFSKNGEKLDALNDKSYTLKDGMTAICDDSGVIGLGGIIGRVPTSVDESTTDIFLEIAYFDPTRVARTGRDLQITSDARYRFERGIDPEFMYDGAALATQMIIDLCGGEASKYVQAGEVPSLQKTFEYDVQRCQKLTGFNVDGKTQSDILTKLGFTINHKSRETLVITPPSWRPDIQSKADIVEEIIRIIGYDKIPAISVEHPHSSKIETTETHTIKLSRLCRNALASRGFQETITWSFMSSQKAELFGSNDNQDVAALRLKNPISEDLDHMRPTPLANLIDAAKQNAAKGFPGSALFEAGPAFIDSSVKGQKLTIAGIRTHMASDRHWSSSQAQRSVDLFDVKGDILALLSACQFDAAKAPISRDCPCYYHPGQSGTIRLGPNILGYFGMIHPAILDEFDIDFPIAGFELFPQAIPQPRKKSAARGKLNLPDLQPVKRDFAFIVHHDVDADSIVKAAFGSNKKLISNISIFDIYTGDKINADDKSVAIEVTLQPVDKTLNEKDLEDISQKIIDAVNSKTGAKLRA